MHKILISKEAYEALKAFRHEKGLRMFNSQEAACGVTVTLPDFEFSVADKAREKKSWSEFILDAFAPERDILDTFALEQAP